MSKIKYKKGCVVKAFKQYQYDVFMHGCNCQGVMGAGVAKVVKEELPALYWTNQLTKGSCVAGTYSSIQYNRGSFTKFAFNLYTQKFYGRDKKHFELKYFKKAFSNALNSLNGNANGRKISLCMPKIGAGLGGGDWEEVEEWLEGELDGMWKDLLNITVYGL